MTKNEVFSIINEDWDHKILQPTINSIVDYAWNKQGQRIDTKELTQFNPDFKELLLALQYLSLDRIPLLEMCFELQDQGKVYEISNRNMGAALTKGTLTHPLTNEEIKDYERKVFIYFKVKPIEEL